MQLSGNGKMKSIAEQLQELDLDENYNSEQFKRFMERYTNISKVISTINNSPDNTDNSQLELQFEAALTDPRRI